MGFLGALDHGSLRRAEPGTVWDAPVGPFGEGTKDMALARLFSDIGVDVTSPGCCTGVETAEVSRWIEANQRYVHAEVANKIWCNHAQNKGLVNAAPLETIQQ